MWPRNVLNKGIFCWIISLSKKLRETYFSNFLIVPYQRNEYFLPHLRRCFTRCRCIKWSYIKSYKIRSVAFRSHCIMIILDKWFTDQLESNSLYSILHISETKPMRNSTCAPWSSVVWLFDIPNCDDENVVIPFLDRVILWVHSGSDKSNLAPDHERYSHPSAPSRSVRHYIKPFCARLNILISNSCFRTKRVQLNCGYELSLNDRPGANPSGRSGA
jgi:hypothetical protein